jgi:hypothetical protein
MSPRTTLMIRVFLVTFSEPHAKLPVSRRSARYLCPPPRTRTVWIRFAPSLVPAGWRPSSNFRFLRYWARWAPVAERLCRVSRVIPASTRRMQASEPRIASRGQGRTHLDGGGRWCCKGEVRRLEIEQAGRGSLGLLSRSAPPHSSSTSSRIHILSFSTAHIARSQLMILSWLVQHIMAATSRLGMSSVNETKNYVLFYRSAPRPFREQCEITVARICPHGSSFLTRFMFASCALNHLSMVRACFTYTVVSGLNSRQFSNTSCASAANASMDAY